MNIFLKILYSFFGKDSDEIIESDSRYVYVDSRDTYLVDEKKPSRHFLKTEILERFKLIYEKRQFKKTLFGFVIYNKIYITEIRQIPFKDLKERFIEFRNKKKVLLAMSDKPDSKKVLLLFVPNHLKLESKPPIC